MLATLGVAFLLFLAGLDLDFDQIRGRPMRLACYGFVLSVVIGLVVTLPLGLFDVIIDPVYVTVILSATSLGIVMPVLKDVGQTHTAFGGLVVVSCSVAEFGSIIALSMFFSRSGTPKPLETVLKLIVLAARGRDHRCSRRPGRRLAAKVNDACSSASTTPSAQLRRAHRRAAPARAASSSPDRLQFDAILGAFLAGAVIAALADPVSRRRARGTFGTSSRPLGFGFFVPVFFVSCRASPFPVDCALLLNATALRRVPPFLGLLPTSSRALPALVPAATTGISRNLSIGPAAADAGHVAVVHRGRRRDRRDAPRAPTGQRGG